MTTAPIDGRGALDEPRVLRNRAVEVNEANMALVAAAQWEELRASAHPDFVMEDRRTVLTEQVIDRYRAVEGATALDDLGQRLARSEVVATRGDLVALMRQTFAVSDFELEWLCVLQIDEAGRSVRYVQFDPDALDHALAELNHLGLDPQESDS